MAVIVRSDALDRVRQALQSFGDRFELTWLQELPLDALLATVHRLPRTISILYLLQLKEGTGENYFACYNHLHVARDPCYAHKLEDGRYGIRWSTLSKSDES
jgi:hypothetical protein